MTPVESGAESTRSAGWRRLAGRLGVEVHPGEGSIALLLFLCFFLFITFQYATKSVRQSTFIDSLGATNLPWVYLGVALVSYPFLRLYSRFAGRVARHRLIAATCLVIAGSLVGFWWLFAFDWWWIPIVLYVWISIAYVMNVSQFWLFSNHVLDPRQAKRLFGFVGAGGLLGGVAGGQVASLVSRLFDTRTTFLVAAAILMMAAAAIYLVHHRQAGQGKEEKQPTEDAGLAKLDKARGGFQVIRGSRPLQAISAVLVVTVVVAQIIDVQFNWAVERAITELNARTAFYGNFYSIMNISAFLFQLVFTSRIHRTLGVGFAMRILPVTMALGTGALFFAATMLPAALLTAAFILKVGENGLRYSLDQATRELLFLPVPSMDRIKAKAFIDVFIQRAAKGLAAVLLLPVVLNLITPVDAGWISLILIVGWLGVTVWAYREYVRSFRTGLKKRTVDTEVPINLADVTTLELLVQSLGSSDSRQVLHSLEILSSHGRGKLVPPLLLYHDEPEVRRRTLELLAEQQRDDAAPLIERRLGDEDPDVRAEAVRVLAKIHGQNVCELMVPRLREADAGVRAAAVACLASFGDAEMAERASAVLTQLLSDADPRVRTEGAKAIGAIQEPRFQSELLLLLYDREPAVAREAIAAVRRRVARDGYNPLYAPTLISLLQNRRVKHETREALVAFGEQVIPALAHFMNDPDEPLWVRRALPKTVARIGTGEAAAALLESLEKTRDAFLRRKVVEALNALPREVLQAVDRARLEGQVLAEAKRYARQLLDLGIRGVREKARFDGPTVVWDSDAMEPELLDLMLAERMEENLTNVFDLLALLYPPRDIRAAHRSLLSGSSSLRAHAIEYLDNTLSGSLRQIVLAIIEERPLDDRIALAKKTFSVGGRSRQQLLEEALAAPEDVADAAALKLAALYQVYTDRMTGLYSRVQELLASSEDPHVAETANWVARRLKLLPAS